MDDDAWPFTCNGMLYGLYIVCLAIHNDKEVKSGLYETIEKLNLDLAIAAFVRADC